MPWYRWPSRVVLFVLGLIWLGQILYAGRLLIVAGPSGVLSWLYHIARSVTADGQAVVPTGWDVIAQEGCLLVLTVVLWFASGLKIYLPHSRKKA